MPLCTLPQPIKAFLQATASRNRAALLAFFVDDAVLVDIGKERRGNEIARWMDSSYLGSNVRVHPLHIEERDGHTVLAVAVDGDYAALRMTEPFQLDHMRHYAAREAIGAWSRAFGRVPRVTECSLGDGCSVRRNQVSRSLRMIASPDR